MSRKIINIGSANFAGDGEPIRDALIKVNQNFEEVYNDIDIITATDIPTDLKGSVFADDSTLLVDAVNASIPYSVLSGAPAIPTDVGDLTDTGNLLSGGSAFSGSYNDLTDTPAIPAELNDLTDVNTTAPANGDFLMYANGEWINAALLNNIESGSNISLLTNDAGYITLADVTGEITVNPTGDLKGSVFADDSTLLVDGVNGAIVGPIVAPTVFIEANAGVAVIAAVNDVAIISGQNNVVLTAGQDVRIRSNGDGSLYNWVFKRDGNLEFPDATVQSTAYPGPQNTLDGDSISIGRVDVGEVDIYGDVEFNNGVTAFQPGNSVSFNGPVNFASATVTGLGGGSSDSLISNDDINITINNDDSSTYMWNFGNTGDLTIPGRLILTSGGVQETFQPKTDATGVVDHDCSLGHIFYHTSPDANWTANFINLDLGTSASTNLVLVIEQGATPYYPSAVQISGAAQTIKWLGNVTPTPSANKTEIATFTIFNNAGTFTVLGSYSTYG